MLGKQIISEKENIWFLPKVDHEKCIKCGQCVRLCSRDVFSIENMGSVVDKEKAKLCRGCLNCYHICPKKAIEVEEKIYAKTKSGVMSFYELAENRQSIRDYSSKPVSREDLVKCVEAARLAPTSRNSQQIRFILADSNEAKEKVANAVFFKGSRTNYFVMKNTPCFVLMLQEKSDFIMSGIPSSAFADVDTGLLAAYFCLQATELGLSTCILGKFDEEIAKELLNIPDDIKISLIISVGYATKDYVRCKMRKDLSEILSFNAYQN